MNIQSTTKVTARAQPSTSILPKSTKSTKPQAPVNHESKDKSAREKALEFAKRLPNHRGS